MGRAGCCSGGQSSVKLLIRLSADGCRWVPFLLVVWPEATQHWSLPGLFGGANGGLWEDSHQGVLPRTSAASVLVLMVSHSAPPTPATAGDPPTPMGRSSSVSYGVTALPLGPDMYTTLCVPSKSGASVSPSLVKVLQSNPPSLQSLIL